MQFFLALIGFFFLLVTAGFAAFLWKVRRHVRQFRDTLQENMQDDAFQRMADKNYYRKHRNEGPMFDEEYFRGDPTGERARQQKQQQQQAKQTRRTTQTADGVTIVDDRDPQAHKKIFAQDEGEYVDFKED